MISLSTVPGIIFALLSVAAILSAAVAVVRSQLVRSQLEALRGDRDDLQSRLDEVRKENADCKLKIDDLQRKYDAEVQARRALETVVTGKKELEAVLAILERHDQRAAHVQQMIKTLLDRTTGGNRAS